MPKPHRTFPEERDGPSPHSKVWKEASPVAPSVPLFCFPFICYQTPTPSAGISSPALCFKLCGSPSILILGAVSVLTTQRPWTLLITPHYPLPLIQYEQLCPTDGSAFCQGLSRPWAHSAPGSSSPRNQRTQLAFSWNFFTLPYTSSPGPRYKLNSAILQIFTR